METLLLDDRVLRVEGLLFKKVLDQKVQSSRFKVFFALPFIPLKPIVLMTNIRGQLKQLLGRINRNAALAHSREAWELLALAEIFSLCLFSDVKRLLPTLISPHFLAHIPQLNNFIDAGVGFKPICIPSLPASYKSLNKPRHL